MEPARTDGAAGDRLRRTSLQAIDRPGRTNRVVRPPRGLCVNDVIELRELRCSAIVGVLAEERDRAHPLVFDLDLVRPFEAAAINDDIAETTNYADVLSLTVRTATEGRYLLLETLAYRVAYEVLALDQEIDSVTVSVRKVRPPVAQDVASTGVRCTVHRP